jgi:hypothetical protein
MAQALRQVKDGQQQLALYGGESKARHTTYGGESRARHTTYGGGSMGRARAVPRRAVPGFSRTDADAPTALLCAGCRAREARYGFRDENHPQADRPRTLCFDCFRMEIGRRQAVAAQLARGWNAQQVRLPLEETLKQLDRRRRRAQIAARHALD